MMFKLLCYLTFALAFVNAAPKTKKVELQLLDDDTQLNDRREEDNVNERISALYVKDGKSGELRFLAGGGGGGGGFGGGGGGNSNAGLNQLITSKQDFLEQLRPSGTGSGSGTANGIDPIIVNLGATGTGTAVTGTATNANTGSNSALNTAINASPVADLLPQIIAGAVVNRRTVGNRRRGSANRNRNSNRNRNRRRRPGNGNGNRQVYVIRPNRG